MAEILDLNIFFSFHMKRDWAEQRCYVTALSRNTQQKISPLDKLYDVVRIDKERVPVCAARQCRSMGVDDAGDLLTRELTEYAGDVTGVSRHQFLYGTFYFSGDVAGDHRHRVLK